MRKFIIIPAAIAALVMTACGSSAPPSPEDQVHASATKFYGAMISDHPLNTCAQVIDPKNCTQDFTDAKAFGLDLGEFAKQMMPKDWRTLIKQAKVVVKGNTARMAPMTKRKDDEPTDFVKQDGKWLPVWGDDK